MLRLGGYILCVFLLSFLSHSEAQQGCVWFLTANTLIYGGNGTNSATSLAACQALCLNTPGCVGIDWDPNNPGSKCYLQTTKTGKVNATGVSHYDYNCPSDACNWTRFVNTNIFGGAQNPAASIAACQTACYYNVTCQSIDWSYTNPPGAQCFLLQQQTGKNIAQSVDHFDLDRNSCTATVPPVISSPSSPTLFSTTSSPGPGGCTWFPYPNNLIYGGNGTNSATTLATCQALCSSTPGCVSIDWDPNNPGSKCYLQRTQTGRVNATGVTHYDLVCNGSTASPSTRPPPPPPVCTATYSVAANTSSYGGLLVPAIITATDCFTACYQLRECAGLDLGGQYYTNCWLYLDSASFQRKYFQANVVQQTINRCPEQDVYKCNPAYDANNVLVDSCLTFCVPSWSRLENTAGTGSGAWVTVQPWDFDECLDQCVQTSSCIGVELLNQPGVQIACKFYVSTERAALANTSIRAFVTQYRILDPCGTLCTTSWERNPQARFQLIPPISQPSVTTEADCLKACRVSTTCEAAQWTFTTSPSCTLADYFIEGSKVSDGSSVTYLFRENCPAPPMLNPTPNPEGSSSSTSLTTSQPRSSATSFQQQQCWVLKANSNTPQGTANSATTVSQCQAACLAVPSSQCSSIDWDNTRSSGQQCFLHSTVQTPNPSPGVDHYDRIC